MFLLKFHFVGLHITFTPSILCSVESMFEQDFDSSFDRMVSTVYKQTSRYLLETLIDRYHFLNHLHVSYRLLSNYKVLGLHITFTPSILCSVESMFEQDFDSSFDRMVSTVYKQTSRYLLETLIDRYHFLNHLHVSCRLLSNYKVRGSYCLQISSSYSNMDLCQVNLRIHRCVLNRIPCISHYAYHNLIVDITDCEANNTVLCTPSNFYLHL
ncbi:hypothetical protein AHF37_06919 [Paragonimus kellicotti]|nr:hypothetical protein AHF37_06919 [Paragonimus kellicotti]